MDENKMPILNAIEQAGWRYCVDNDDCIEIGQFSPAGEDFSFIIEGKDIVQEVQDYADEFDADEHAEFWVKARETVGDVPSIRTLINDADEIQNMLNELSNKLKELENITDLSDCDKETKNKILENAERLRNLQCKPCEPTQPECGKCEFVGGNENEN